MIVSLIVATAENNVIGNDNKMIWHLPRDLKYFKETTLGHHIIMGRKNYESIGKPLKERTNIVVTRQPSYAAAGCVVTHSIEDALDLARENKESEAFIIGGGEIYNQSLSVANKIYLTRIFETFNGDVTFPVLDPNLWKETSANNFGRDEKNRYDCCFYVYEKKDNLR